MDKIKALEQDYLKTTLPEFHVGDTVGVQVRISEGEKVRVQLFVGTVIARSGSGINETFTVRRIVAGEGVERVFPLHSASVVDVEVQRRGKVRRAKLYYLRNRVGKATKVRELVEPLKGEQKKRVKKRGGAVRQARLAGKKKVATPELASVGKEG